MEDDDEECAELSAAQVEHFTLIFGLSDFDGDGDLELSELSKYMRNLGHGLSVEELQNMLRMVNVSEHDGKITLEDFLTFIRRTIFAPIKKANLQTIEDLFEKKAHAKASALTNSRNSRPSSAGMPPRPAVATPRRPPGAAETDGLHVLSKVETGEVLANLGLHLDDLTFSEVFDEVDADNDGHISHGEFVAALGMLKRSLVETRQLEVAFTRLRQGQRDSAIAAGETPLDEHLVYASDLVATLGVSQSEAEEMIFIADLAGTRAVDISEFKALVVNWTRS